MKLGNKGPCKRSLSLSLYSSEQNMARHLGVKLYEATHPLDSFFLSDHFSEASGCGYSWFVRVLLRPAAWLYESVTRHRALHCEELPMIICECYVEGINRFRAKEGKH